MVVAIAGLSGCVKFPVATGGPLPEPPAHLMIPPKPLEELTGDATGSQEAVSRARERRQMAHELDKLRSLQAWVRYSRPPK